MTAVLSSPPLAEPPPSRFTGVVMHGISWETYERLLEDIGDQHVRLTYDRGSLEITMSPSPTHDFVKTMVARLIEIYSLECDIPVAGFGSMTVRRKDVKRGLEPDECYYVAKEPLVRGRTDLNFEKDPPPDLALEVDVSPHALDRPSIYAALGVPELWRFDGVKIVPLHRGAEGRYAIAEASLAFPSLPIAELNRHLALAAAASQHEAAKAFRDWARANPPK